MFFALHVHKPNGWRAVDSTPVLVSRVHLVYYRLVAGDGSPGVDRIEMSAGGMIPAPSGSADPVAGAGAHHLW